MHGGVCCGWGCMAGCVNGRGVWMGVLMAGVFGWVFMVG